MSTKPNHLTMFSRIPFGRLVNWAIVGLVLIALVFLYFAEIDHQRVDNKFLHDKMDLASIAAKDAFLSEIDRAESDLNTISSWLPVSRIWAIDHHELAKQFFPLLVESRNIEAVRIAAESGYEFSMVDDGKYLTSCIQQPDSTGVDSCFLWDKTAFPDLQFSGIDLHKKHKDPRANSWFSNAVRTGGTVSWKFQNRDSSNFLIGSVLVRDSIESTRLAVAAIELSTAELVLQMLHVPSRVDASIFLKMPDGSSVYPRGTQDPERLEKLAQAASGVLSSGSYDRITEISVESRPYKLSYREIPLEGVSPLLVLALPVNTSRTIFGVNRYVVAGLILVILISVLLVVGWRRRRLDSRRIMVQEARSRSQQRQLRQALDEREVLDREVHHRVKNNLQIVSSLLNMQRMRLTHEETITVFDQSKQRVEAIAQIHNALYRSKDLRGIDLQEFLKGVIDWLHQQHAPENIVISYEVHAAGITADMDAALDLGMIVAELVVNCYKHAFPYVTGGHIDISVINLERDRYKLVVQDNGRGMNADLLETDKVNRLGLDLVEALVEGLDGTFSYHSDNGVYFEAIFSIVPRESIPRPV